jgi:hypothetical protein
VAGLQKARPAPKRTDADRCALEGTERECVGEEEGAWRGAFEVLYWLARGPRHASPR